MYYTTATLYKILSKFIEINLFMFWGINSYLNYFETYHYPCFKPVLSAINKYKYKRTEFKIHHNNNYFAVTLVWVGRYI